MNKYDLLLKSGEWSVLDSCVTYSFFASLAIMMGYTEKQSQFVKDIYEYFFSYPIKKDSFEYQMLESLGKLPIRYHLGEIIKLTDIKKQQVKLWYQYFILLEPMLETPEILKVELPIINNYFSKF